MAVETTLSAGIIPVRLEADGPLFLVLRSYRYWDFPKGEIEPNEEPLRAAMRELTEETGLGKPVLRWGQSFTETPRYGRGKIARYYLAEVSDGNVHLPVSAELGRPEHDEFRWVTARQAQRLFNPRLKAVLDWALAMMGDARNVKRAIKGEEPEPSPPSGTATTRPFTRTTARAARSPRADTDPPLAPH